MAIGSTMAPLVRLLMWVCSPITWPLGKLLDWVLGHEDVTMKRQHLKAMVQLHGQDAGLGGKLTQQEVNVISGAMDMRHKTAIAAMTPLSKVHVLVVCVGLCFFGGGGQEQGYGAQREQEPAGCLLLADVAVHG